MTSGAASLSSLAALALAATAEQQQEATL